MKIKRTVLNEKKNLLFIRKQIGLIVDQPKQGDNDGTSNDEITAIKFSDKIKNNPISEASTTKL